MKGLPSTPELLAIAERVIWFEPAAQALETPLRFMAYLLTYGTPEEIAALGRHLAPEDWREAIEQAPPGILDERSWAYWNVMLGRYPVPPMPRRTFAD